jgi:ATP-binding cassette, subfamily B, bacterial PglK
MNVIKYLSKIIYILPGSKSSLIILTCAFTLVSLMEALGIGLIGPFINLASSPEVISQNSWLNWLYLQTGLVNKNQFIALLGLLITIIFIIKSFINHRVQTYVFTFSYKQQGLLISKLIHAYLNAQYIFILSKSTSQIIQNVICESKIFSNEVLIPLLNFASNLIITSSLFILLASTNLATIIVILLSIIPVVLLLNSFKNKISYWGKEASESDEEIIRIINHSLGGIKETKIIGCESYFEAQIAQQGDRYVKALSGIFSFRLLPRAVIETLLVIFLIGFISIFLVINQDIKKITAVLSVFAIAAIRLIPAISNLATGLATLKNASFSVNKLYIDLKEIDKLEKDKFLNQLYESNFRLDQELTFANEISLDAVTYCYPNTPETALNSVSLTIKKGQSIAFIGKSGAGKTTLIDVILGLLIPQVGDITVDGKTIYSNLRYWQNMIGYIPQSIFLIEDTIEKNIAFGVPEHLINYNRLNQVVQMAQLGELIARLPKGLQTMVGERGVLLSGGQRQRIGIARALYHKREILVLDEATAALDNETESLITEAMHSLSGKKTLIIIAHRLTTVEHCDRIYVMEKGRIVNSGSYKEVVLK